MATYPQGVTDFIPDYQPYQPDLTILANTLQLKQTQYDKNWQSLNKVYGQIYNAQLTHDDSRANRDDLVKRIDFDLRRVSGLDLSLDQNVQQATQVFRPFYEDSNLMKDMAWTKNTGFNQALGQGKKMATKKEDRDQYWAGALRAIDYKIQEFKDTPYNELTGVADVSWTPYVNVEAVARKLAEDSGLSIDITDESPDHRWLVRQKNGDQLIGPLQNLFYSELGSNPAVQEFYQTSSYLVRKDNMYGNKDNPEFKGDPLAAEQKYLSNSLSMLKSQNQLQIRSLENEKSVYQKNLTDLEKLSAQGQGSPDTQNAIDQLKTAISQTDTRLNGSKEDLNLVSDNLNRTLTTVGGSKLSMDDLQSIRFRVDNAMASGLMQADFDKAAKNNSLRGYVYDKKPNPYQVNLESHGHRMSEINARAKAQWDLTLLKAGIKQEELMTEAKIKSGNYIVTKDKNGNESLVKNPLLNSVQLKEGKKSVTPGKNIEAIQDVINDVMGVDPKKTQLLAVATVQKLWENGKITDDAMLDLLGKDGLSETWEQNITKFLEAYTVNPDEDWTNMSQTKNSAQARQDLKVNILRQGIYETSLEKQDRLNMEALENKRPKKEKINEQLQKLSKANLVESDPVQVQKFTTRLFQTLSSPSLKDQLLPGSLMSEQVIQLQNDVHNLSDYSSYLSALKESKKINAFNVIDRLKAEDYQYADLLFDENYDRRSQTEFTAALAASHPEHLTNASGMTWAGFLNTTAAGAGTGAAVGGSIGLAGGPLAPLTVSSGAGAGAIAGGLISGGAYIATGGIMALWNGLFGDEETGADIGLLNGKTGPFHKNNVDQEFYDMESVINMVGEGNKTDWNFETVGMPGLGIDGSGKYTAGGAGIVVRPGVTNTDMFPQYIELQKIINGISSTDPSINYVSLTGVNSTRDEIGGKEELMANAAVWRFVRDKYQSEVLKKDSKAGDIEYTVSPLAGSDFGKASVTIQPTNMDFLKPYVISDSNPGGIITATQYADMTANGISMITSASNLLGSSLYRNSYQSLLEARIEREKTVTYSDYIDPDYNITYSKNPLNTNQYFVTEQWKTYNPNTGRDTIIKNTQNLGDQGKNLGAGRARYLSEIVPQRKLERIQLYNQYGRSPN